MSTAQDTLCTHTFTILHTTVSVCGMTTLKNTGLRLDGSSRITVPHVCSQVADPTRAARLPHLRFYVAARRLLLSRLPPASMAW